MLFKKFTTLLLFIGLIGVNLAYAENPNDLSWYLLPGASHTWTDSDVRADSGLGGFLKIGKESGKAGVAGVPDFCAFGLERIAYRFSRHFAPRSSS